MAPNSLEVLILEIEEQKDQNIPYLQNTREVKAHHKLLEIGSLWPKKKLKQSISRMYEHMKNKKKMNPISHNSNQLIFSKKKEKSKLIIGILVFQLHWIKIKTHLTNSPQLLISETLTSNILLQLKLKINLWNSILEKIRTTQIYHLQLLSEMKNNQQHLILTLHNQVPELQI